MNVEEGARRMKRAGQWLFAVPSTIVILAWAVTLAATLLNQSIGILVVPDMVFAVIALYLAIAGGVLWLAAWIVEGFAKKGIVR
jgi:hypothetical protein